MQSCAHHARCSGVAPQSSNGGFSRAHQVAGNPACSVGPHAVGTSASHEQPLDDEKASRDSTDFA